MKITITMNLDDSLADPEHRTGVTVVAYEQITDMLGHLGDNIDVQRAE